MIGGLRQLKAHFANGEQHRHTSIQLLNRHRHWPIGLIYDNHTISTSLKPSSSRPPANATPLRLILHLASPPNDKLLLSPGIEACKQSFMGQLKEADFMRWGNTRRMTGLRKQDQDGIWEGIKERMSFAVVPFCESHQTAV